MASHLPKAESCVLVVPNLEAVEEAVHAEVNPADLVAFLSAAVRRNNEAVHEKASRKTDAPYRSPAWVLAATLRGHPAFSSLPASAVVTWLDRQGGGKGGDFWQLLPQADCFDEPVDPRLDFINAWDRVRKAIALVPTLGDAARFEKRWPLTAAHWLSDRDAMYRKLIGVMYWYARLLAADGAFYLSCRVAGRFLEVDHKQAWQLLRRAEREGLLQVVRRGDKGFGKATRYRFRLDAVQLVETAPFKGAIQLAGDLTGTAASPQIAANKHGTVIT